jgi:hypothetical protein
MIIITPYRGHSINWSHYNTARSMKDAGIDGITTTKTIDADKAVFITCCVIAVVAMIWGI